MRLQLIFCVETNKQTKSDWIYISETIRYFYDYDRSRIKLSPVYLGGKGKYNQDKTKKTIETLREQFAAGSRNGGESVVILVLDTDEYFSNPEDVLLLNQAKLYCKENGYKFSWFCKDIEQVYINRRVHNNVKKMEAERFLLRNEIRNVDSAVLKSKRIAIGKSNLMLILDEYLKR